MKITAPISVSIIDDNESFCDRLVKMIEESSLCVVVGAYSNGREAMDGLANRASDMVLIDFCLPVIDGLQMACWVTLNLPKSKSILISVTRDRERVLESVVVGAKGFIIKDDIQGWGLKDLEEVLRRVNAGETYFSPTADQLKQPSLLSEGQMRMMLALTSREIQILRLVHQGDMSCEIAGKMTGWGGVDVETDAGGLSIETINWHRKHILQKTNDLSKTLGLGICFNTTNDVARFLFGS